MGNRKDSGKKSGTFCAVPQCLNSVFPLGRKKLSFHRFPTNEKMRFLWKVQLRTPKEITDVMRVCSEHFLPNDYLSTAKTRPRLKKSAVPSQKLPGSRLEDGEIDSISWDDHLKKNERFGRQSSSNEYKKITRGTEQTYSHFQEGAHVLLYALTDQIALDCYKRKAIVLMQMRFDGYLGFPGGLLDSGESPHVAATRELIEEIAWDTKKFGAITDNDFVSTYVSELRKLSLHFYAKQVNEQDIKTILENSMQASDFGNESLGMVLVPLYTMGDSFRGFPSFLRNHFIGNAKSQLTDTLVQLNILSQDYVDNALSAVPVPLD